MQNGDADGDVVYLQNDCGLAADGFQDENAFFQFTDGPAAGTYPGMALRAYRVWEIRHSTSGAGRRAADDGWANGASITTNSFSVKLIKELEGVSLYTWYGSCPAGTSTPTACMNYAVAHHYYHDEAVLCIWNPVIGASGNVNDWCTGEKVIGDQGTSNSLPVASFVRPQQPGEGMCVGGPGGSYTFVALWDYDASASTDADGGSLSYIWDYHGIRDSLSEPHNDWKMWCDYLSEETVRLRVRDGLGGQDVLTRVLDN